MKIVMAERYGMPETINGNVAEFLGCNWMARSDTTIVPEDKQIKKSAHHTPSEIRSKDLVRTMARQAIPATRQNTDNLTQNEVFLFASLLQSLRSSFEGSSVFSMIGR